MKNSRSIHCGNGLHHPSFTDLLLFKTTVCTDYFWCESGAQKEVNDWKKKQMFGTRRLIHDDRDGGLASEPGANLRAHHCSVKKQNLKTGQSVTKATPDLLIPAVSKGSGETCDGASATKHWRESVEEPEGGTNPGADGGRGGEKSSGACRAINVMA